MQQANYNSPAYYQYPQNPIPNPNPTVNPAPIPIDHHYPTPLPPPSHASAPPFTSNYHPAFSSDYSSFPSYPQNPDPIPTAPSYAPPPNLQPFDPLAQPPPASIHPYQIPVQSQPQQAYHSHYDQLQGAPSYAPQTNSVSGVNSSYSSAYSTQYNQLGSAVYENNVKFDRSGGYYDENLGKSGNYSRSRSDSGYGNEGYGDGVYAYQGNKVEPYGARGTATKSSTWSGFDDFGRPIGHSSLKDQSMGTATKIVRAVPKADIQQDVNTGVQKFRVKLLAESGGQSTMDVLCQIGLDGIRMLEPSTSRTLRIYPLDTITRCEVTNSSTFSFWSKSAVDVEPRRIRLQSNGYTTNTLLDTVTAATVQFKEMGGRSRASELVKVTDQPAEKKKGLADWINTIKPVNEEKDHWVPDEAVTKCTACGTDFNAFVRKHHCRNCGDIFCDKCTHGRIALTAEENAPVVRVCDRCMGEVSHRLSTAKEAASRSTGLQSHEDLAKKLQEEMERNRKGSSGSRSDGSGRRMKEVACPTCTVHLQVQVPSSGSETIECGVCQHPFLVSSH